MTFFEAVAKCYRKYFKFRGRAPRSEYWWFFLLGLLFAWPLLLSEFEEGLWFSILSFIYFMLTLSVFIPGAAVWTRRMHDIGRSGWSWMFLFLPVIGVIMVFRWLTKKGDIDENRFGLPDNLPFVTTSNFEVKS
jgi:uncharacterized membrane protein YhaH (DUF805 family)